MRNAICARAWSRRKLLLAWLHANKTTRMRVKAIQQEEGTVSYDVLLEEGGGWPKRDDSTDRLRDSDGGGQKMQRFCRCHV